MAQNTSIKHLRMLKKIANLAVANSYMAANPFTTFKIEKEPVDIDFLDELLGGDKIKMAKLEIDEEKIVLRVKTK